MDRQRWQIAGSAHAEVKPSSRQVHSRLYFPSWWHVTSGFPGHQRHIGRGGPLPGLPTSDQQASRERGRKAATLGCQAPLPNRGSRGVPRGFRRCSRGVPGLLKGFRALSAPFFAGAPVVELRPYIILKKENRRARVHTSGILEFYQQVLSCLTCVLPFRSWFRSSLSQTRSKLSF